MADRGDAIALYDIYGGALTEKQRSLFSQYYIDDLSYYEIAENVGISPTGVRDVIVRALRKMIELERDLGFLSMTREIRRAAESAPDESAARRILEILERQNYGV